MSVKLRLIPVVLLRNGVVVQSKGFKRYQRLGAPTTIVERLTNWASDELIYLDISRQASYDLGRDDLGDHNRSSLLEILGDISKLCFMPLTFGGGIRRIDDVGARIKGGADKVSINSEAVRNPDFIMQCAREYGSQCIVISVDALRKGDKDWEVYIDGGKTRTGLSPIEWAKKAQDRGAGEIFLNSIDRDGNGQGYDLALVERVVRGVSIPVIACGGVGSWEHFSIALKNTGVSAVAAANIFNYTENSVFNAKRYLHEAGFNVRKPDLGINIDP